MPRAHSRNPLERIAGFLALWCIAMLLVMFSRPDFSNAAKPRHGIPDPVLALQMAHDLADVDAVLSDAPSLDREVMRIKQYEDFGFIAGYAALYFVSALLLVRTHPALRWIALVATLAGTAAAALDVTENFAILRILDVPLAATTQGMIDDIHVTAMFKWALGFLALALLSTWFFRDSRRTSRVVGAIYLAAALVGAYGLIDNAVLVFGAGLILLGLLGAVIVFLLLP
jgi:hypothetical protein